MGHVPREEYLKELREKSKELILKTVKLFDAYDGNLTKIGKAVDKSKQSVSRILNSELFMEMVKNGEIDKEKSIKIKDKINENKINGNKKGLVI